MPAGSSGVASASAGNVCERDFRCRWTVLALGLLLAGHLGAASAAELTVHITKQGTGGAVADADVCVGTAADPAQFASVRTNRDGTARVPGLPRAPLTVLVSKPGFLGRSLALEALDTDRDLLVSLALGGGGPRCPEPTGEAQTPPPGVQLRLSEFRINGGEATTAKRTVRLDFHTSGQATHYRASERPDFAGAEWQAVHQPLRFRLSAGAGTKTVYFQVRKYRSSTGGEIETVSNVVSDTIVLAGG